jgi:hypothetical protein
MPTTARVFHITADDDDQSFGATVKRLNETQPSANSDTIIRWATTTVTEKTVIPLADNSTSGDSSINNGWAFNNGGADGLGSTTAAKRRVRAGEWTFILTISLNAPATLDTHALTITAKVYRVATGGGSRSLLFTSASPNQTSGGRKAWVSTEDEIVLDAGEVILVSFTMTSASTTAVVLGANTQTVVEVDFGANSYVVVPEPGIETLAIGAGSASGSSVVDADAAGIAAMEGATSGASAVAGQLSAVAETAGQSAGSSSGAAELVAISTTNGASAGTSQVSGDLAAVGVLVGSSEGSSTVVGLIGRTLPTVGSSEATANVSGELGAVAEFTGAAIGASSSTGSFGAISETVGLAEGSSTADGSFGVIASTEGTATVCDGGGGTTFIYPINIFDD